MDMDQSNNSVHSMEASSTTIISNSNTEFATPNMDASSTRSQHTPRGRPNFANGVGLRQLLEATIAIRYTPYGPKPKLNMPENERSSPVGADAMDVVVVGQSDNSTELSGSNTAETQNNNTKTKKKAKESSRVVRRKRGELPRVESRMVTRSRSSASLNAESASSSSNRNSSSPMPELSQPADETPSPTSSASVPTSAVTNADVEMTNVTQNQNEIPSTSSTSVPKSAVANDVEMTNGSQNQNQQQHGFRKPNGRAPLDAQKGILPSLNLRQEQDAPGAPPTHAVAAENSPAPTPSTSSAYLLNNLAAAALGIQTKSAEKIVPRLSSNVTTTETSVQQQDRPLIAWLVSSPVPLKSQGSTTKNQDINAGTSVAEPTMFRTSSLEDLADIALSAADSPYMGELNHTPMDHDSPSSVPETADRRNIASSSRSGSDAPVAQQQIQEPRPMSLLDNPNLNPDGKEKIPTVVKFYDPLRMYSKNQLIEEKTKNVTQISSSSNTPCIQEPVAINPKEFHQGNTQAIQSSSSATAACIQGPQPMSLLDTNAEALVQGPQPMSLLNMNANALVQESQPTAHMDINDNQESQPTRFTDINYDVAMQDPQPTAQQMDINEDDLHTDMELNEEDTQAVHILSSATIPCIQEPRPMSLLDINSDFTRKIPAAGPYFDPLLAHSQKAQQAKLDKSQGAVQNECNVNPDIQQVNLQPEINDIPVIQQINLQPEMNVNTAVDQVNLQPVHVNPAVEQVGLQPEINVYTAVERVGLQPVVNVNTAVEQVGLPPVVHVNTAVEQVGLQPVVNVNTAVERVGLQPVVNDNPALEQVNLLTEVRKIPRCLITNPPSWVTTGPRSKALRQSSAPPKNKLHSKQQSEQHVSPVITAPTVAPVAFKQPINPRAPTSPSKRKGLPHRSPSHTVLQQHPTREAREEIGIVQMNVFEEYVLNPSQLISSRANDELAAQRLIERQAMMSARTAPKGRGRAKKTAKVSTAAPKKKKKAAVEKAANAAFTGAGPSGTKSDMLSARDSAISLDATNGVRRGRSAGVSNAGSLKRGRDAMASGDEVDSNQVRSGEQEGQNRTESTVRNGASFSNVVKNSKPILSRNGGRRGVGSGEGSGKGGEGSGSGDGAVGSCSSGGGVGRQAEGGKRRKTAGGNYVATGAGLKLFPSSWSSTGAASATRMAAEAAATSSAVAAPSPSFAGTRIGGPVGGSGSHSSTAHSNAAQSEGPGGDASEPGSTNDKLRVLPFELISRELLADYTSCKQRGDPVTWKKTPVTYANCAGIDLLADDEVEVCSVLRVPPVDYLHVKHILLSARDKFETFTKRQAQKWYGIDVNKTGKIFDWFVSKNWLLLPPKGKDAPQAMVAVKAKPARRRR
ncbi:Transcriptional adapter ada2 [Chytriomyces hyalinus]|nr:Transcriptional adapter ada2 [Chytriomyces hyalinus]